VNERTNDVVSFSKVVAAILVILSGPASAQTPQEYVHEMAHSVMPFDMSKTVHIFRMTESGGVQQVIARDSSDAEQITLVQQHLRHEAENFQQGNYADPATLHGADMPGLEDLEAGAARIKVSFMALPGGAEISFDTTDLHLITAIHRWFGAQLSEHGADARAE
jgi:hypothetical protein